MYYTHLFDEVSHTSNTGEMPKQWDEKHQYLYKFDKTAITYEVYSEILCSHIANLLDIEHVEYTLQIRNGREPCCCRNFLAEDETLITPADMILCNKYSAEEARSHMCKLNPILYSQMLLLDFLVLNTDRHYGNLGSIVGSKERMAPLFDHDAALYSSRLNDSGNPYDIVDLWCSERLYSGGIGTLLYKAAVILKGASFNDIISIHSLRANIDEIFYGLHRFSKERISSLRALILNRLKFLEEYDGRIL